MKHVQTSDMECGLDRMGMCEDPFASSVVVAVQAC